MQSNSRVSYFSVKVSSNTGCNLPEFDHKSITGKLLGWGVEGQGPHPKPNCRGILGNFRFGYYGDEM